MVLQQQQKTIRRFVVVLYNDKLLALKAFKVMQN